ncbi:hypothetical protein [Pelagicoccus sp. SDUM812002]|uniref:hypothetical protein n=1 Tax=Pelagicoccus sp. SDUM812002 TaxID=3041266 RepID=UPI00280F12C7|nr:hypothetical protein [Pelagicoccus sp. SDUM812002]MDQ8188187.1 hypothetical protein [Pelagicoccus sp. SDUM812002]
MKEQFVYFLNKRSFWVGALSLSILTVGFALKPAYRSFKVWRAQNIFSDSKELIEEEAYLRGFERAQAAVMLNPRNVEALRHLATLSVDFGHPLAYRYCDLVLKSEEANEEDWARSVDAAFQAGETKQVFENLTAWKYKEGSQSAAFALREAKAFLSLSDYSVALAILEEARAAHPTSVDVRDLTLAVLSFVGSSSALQAAAEEILARATPIDRKELEWVSQQKRLPHAPRLRALEHLLSGSELTLADQTRFLLDAYRLGANNAAERIQSLMTQVKRADSETLATYTTALCEIGSYESVLELIPETSEDRILQRNRLFAAIETEQLDEAFAYSALDRSQRLTTVAEETLLRALAYLKSGETLQHKNSLAQAIDAAEVADLPFLSLQFQKLGYTDTLLKLYERFSTKSDFGYRLLPAWLKLSLAHREEASLQRCIKSLSFKNLAIYPPQDRSAFTYYCLVFDLHRQEAIREAETLASRFPQEKSFQSLLALAQWRKGELQTARALLKKLTGPSDSSTEDLVQALILGSDLPQQDRDTYFEAELALLQSR